MTRLAHFSLALSILTLITACASTGGGAAGEGDGIEAAERSGGTVTDCILERTVRDFETLDNRNLIIYGSGGRAHHVILATPSMSLEREIRLGVLDRDGSGRICPYGGDAILVDGPVPERIPIRSIERLDEDGLDALLVEFGKLEAADDATTVTEIN